MPHQFIQEGILMTRFSLAGSTALALLFAASGAMAQVTAEDVWQSWKTMSASVGQTITTTSEAREGDTLVVEGLALAINDPTGLVADSAIGTVRFRDTGTGTVEVTLPESYPISMTIPPEGTDSQGPTTIKMTVSQPGMLMTAGGNATDTSYDFTAPTIAIDVTDVVNADGPANVKFDVDLKGVSGRYLMAGPADAKKLDSTFAATSAVVTGNGTEEASTFAVNVSIADLAGTTKGSFLGIDMMANMATALNAGFASNGSMSYGKTSFEVNVDDAGSQSKVTGAMDGGNIDFGLDKTQLTYAIGMKATEYTISGSQIPIPQVNLGFGEFAFNLVMPVSKSDAPQNFSFLTKIVDLKMSDDIWAMFDPMGQLPRDPATLIIDTKGTAKLNADIMDPAAAAAMEESVPGELNSLDLTQLQVKLAGAQVDGTGALTFDNTDLVTFQGMPAPTGQVDITLTGINALLDTLVAMGLIPEDQVMGARMMLAMFAKPGDAPDTLVSTIEFKDKGLYANGQRLQ
jgi:Uncharacterized protein conserved in bacteria (DUF2125)